MKLSREIGVVAEAVCEDDEPEPGKLGVQREGVSSAGAGGNSHPPGGGLGSCPYRQFRAAETDDDCGGGEGVQGFPGRPEDCRSSPSLPLYDRGTDLEAVGRQI